MARHQQYRVSKNPLQPILSLPMTNDDSQTPIAQQNARAQPSECDVYAESWASRRIAYLGKANHTKAIAILGHQQIHQRSWYDRHHS